MKLQDKFNCVLPIKIEKSVDKQTGVKNYKFRAIASDDSEDADQEVLNPNGFQFDSFLSHGFVNYNHNLKNSPKALVGEPSGAFVNDKNQFIVDGILYGNSKIARDIVETADMLEKAGSKRKFKLSIEGTPIQRSTINPRRIEKARITGLAITLQPKNANTLFSLVKGQQSEDFIDYEYGSIEKSDPNGGDIEYLVDITDKDKGVRVTMDKSLTIKISKALTTDSPSGKAMRKESFEKKPKNLFEFQKAAVTISKGYELGMVPEEMMEKARMHKYLRKEGNKYIYKEVVPKEKKFYNAKISKENQTIGFINEAGVKQFENMLNNKGIRYWKRLSGNKIKFEQPAAFNSASKMVGKEENEKEDIITDKDVVLKITKQFNDQKIKRAQSIKETPTYRHYDAVVKEFESRRVTDKDGNTIGWKRKSGIVKE